MQSVCLDVRKVADFRWKNADVSKTQDACHMIYIILRSSLGLGLTVPSFIILEYVWQI